MRFTCILFKFAANKNLIFWVNSAFQGQIFSHYKAIKSFINPELVEDVTGLNTNCMKGKKIGINYEFTSVLLTLFFLYNFFIQYTYFS